MHANSNTLDADAPAKYREAMPMKSKHDLPDALRAWRRRQKLSQSQAARELRIPVSSLQNWEQARTIPAGFAFRALMDRIKPRRSR